MASSLLPYCLYPAHQSKYDSEAGGGVGCAGHDKGDRVDEGGGDLEYGKAGGGDELDG